MDPAAASASDTAINLVSPIKFHQSFMLPSTDKHGPLKVTYAISGVPIGEYAPTVFFCGGMFGSRYMAVWDDYLATKIGVRVLHVDRPGFGGSTPVPLNQRISTFIEIVPALLKHLNIKYISLASHSSGTIFALNLLATHPELLDPSNPSVTLCCPWVHQSITGVSFLNAAAILPNGLLNYWNNITGFLINTASPTISASSDAISSVTGIFKKKANAEEEEEEKERTEARYMNGLGISSKEADELFRFQTKCAFAEETKGANDEARLCLKSVEGKCGWGAADDYPTVVGELKVWEEKVKGGAEKLRLAVVFAQDDAMIGVKGRKYFEDCWTQEKCGDGIVVQIVQTEGTDHDGVIDTTGSTMRTMFAIAKEGGSWPM